VSASANAITVPLETVRLRLAGISAIPVTPFATDGGIDEAGLRAVVERIVSSGIELLVACGNTSEQASLTDAELEVVTAATLDAAGGAAVLAGVRGDLRTASGQAARAAELGAAGIMIHYPTDPFHRDGGLVSYYRELAAATSGAVVVYVRGGGLPLTVIDLLAETENVVGLKYAVPDVLTFARIVARHGDAFVPVCGLAELWAPFFWLAGARGFTSGLANVVPGLSLALLEFLRLGDYDRAMAVWGALEPFERLRARHASGNNVPVVKEALAILGLSDGSVRPPLAPLDDDDRRELEHVVATLVDAETRYAPDPSP
jgi:4-hydroxy-tetrahydrodipicolinate synthase